MKIPLSVRIKALFARDKDEFWFNHFTDDEIKLRSIDVWQLAEVINEARVRNLAGDTKTIIVAEHLLNERIARIQSRPVWVAIWAGFVGVIGGAFLTSALQSSNNQECICKCNEGSAVQQPIEKVVQVNPTITTVTNAANKPTGQKQQDQAHNAPEKP